MNKAEARRGVPVQLLVMAVITVGLMGVSWFKLLNPEYREDQKARQSISYYLDGLGHAPIDKLGAELHPVARRAFDPASLTAYFTALGLNQPTELRHLSEIDFDTPASEWRWLAEVNAGGKTFPLRVALRQPDQMIGRRWRIYSLCRLDTDLLRQSAQLLQHPTPALARQLKDFQPAGDWQLINTQPLLTQLRGSRQQALQLTWQASSTPRLGCGYTLTQSLLHNGKASP